MTDRELPLLLYRESPGPTTPGSAGNASASPAHAGLPPWERNPATCCTGPHLVLLDRYEPAGHVTDVVYRCRQCRALWKARWSDAATCRGTWLRMGESRLDMAFTRTEAYAVLTNQ